MDTRSFPPVSTPAPPPPPAAPLKPLKPLSNMSCCHLSGSCLGCNRRKRTHLLTSGSPCLCYSQSPHGWVLGQAGAPLPTWPGCSGPPRGSPLFPAHPNHYKQVNRFRHIRTYTRQLNIYRIIKRQGDVLYTTCTCIHFGYIFFSFFFKVHVFSMTKFKWSQLILL